MRISLAIAIILVARLCLAADCIADGAPCSHTVTPCCGMLECTDRTHSGGICTTLADTTTTEAATTTTTSTSSSSTDVTFTSTTSTFPPTSTTLIIPFTNIENPPLRFAASALSNQRPADTVLLDPRNGQPATEYVRFVESMQINWVLLADVINAYPPDCHLDTVAVRDTVSKFGINYVIRGGDTYQWFHPTYEWYIPRHIADRLVECGGSAPMTGPYVQPAGTPLDLGATAGRLDQLPGTPLQPFQCEALNVAAAIHDRQAQAVLDGDSATAAQLGPLVLQTQLAFEATASSLAEEQLFSLIFTGEINPTLDPAVVHDLTVGVMLAHMRWVNAFNCAVGAPPNRDEIERDALDHAERHFCRAINRPDVTLRTVCPGNIDACPTLTCAEIGKLS